MAPPDAVRHERARVAVLGAGSWGTAFARLLVRRGSNAPEGGLNVTLVARRRDQVSIMKRTHRNPNYLSAFELPLNLEFAHDADFDFCQVDLLVLAVPSRAFAVAVDQLKTRMPQGVAVLSLTKGVEPSSLRRLSRVLSEEWADLSPRIAVLSGPNFAEEVMQDQPSATVVASLDEEFARCLQELISCETLRVYVNNDVAGVEIAAAVKNIIAIAAGMSDGVGFGDNAKAALITRGIAEMARFGRALGADPATFAGLAGLGDLVATCTSRHSRNRLAGELIAQGRPAAEVEKEIGMVAEGLTAAPAILQLARRLGVEMPITENVVAIAYEGKNVRDSVRDLMARQSRPEVT